MQFGSLFSGVGAIDLGLERAGMVCKFQVEIDEYARKVLAKHWPSVPRFTDVRNVGAGVLDAVDLLAGGFPCQDISNAGKRVGIDGERSGLWSEFHRIISELRPRYVLVENVPALLERGIERVLGDLAESGYDAEWDIAGACAIGAPMHRERIWILAYPNNAGLQGPIWAGKPYSPREEWPASYSEPLRSDCGPWPPGPRAVNDVPGMADGPANRMDRLKGLGNAVVPQIATWIGEQIMAVDSKQ